MNRLLFRYLSYEDKKNIFLCQQYMTNSFYETKKNLLLDLYYYLNNINELSMLIYQFVMTNKNDAANKVNIDNMIKRIELDNAKRDLSINEYYSKYIKY